MLHSIDTLVISRNFNSLELEVLHFMYFRLCWYDYDGRKEERFWSLDRNSSDHSRVVYHYDHHQELWCWPFGIWLLRLKRVGLVVFHLTTARHFAKRGRHFLSGSIKPEPMKEFPGSPYSWRVGYILMNSKIIFLPHFKILFWDYI